VSRCRGRRFVSLLASLLASLLIAQAAPGERTTKMCCSHSAESRRTGVEQLEEFEDSSTKSAQDYNNDTVITPIIRYEFKAKFCTAYS
jgi:hypothetical protein